MSNYNISPDTKIQLSKNYGLSCNSVYEDSNVVLIGRAGGKAWISKNLSLGKSNFIYVDRSHYPFEELKKIGYTVYRIDVFDYANYTHNEKLVKKYIKNIAAKEKYALIFDIPWEHDEEANSIIAKYFLYIILPYLTDEIRQKNLPHIQIYLTGNLASWFCWDAGFLSTAKKHRLSFIFNYTHLEHFENYMSAFDSACQNSTIVFFEAKNDLLRKYFMGTYCYKIMKVLKENETLEDIISFETIIVTSSGEVFRDLSSFL